MLLLAYYQSPRILSLSVIYLSYVDKIEFDNMRWMSYQTQVSRQNNFRYPAISQSTDFDFESRYFWSWSGTNEDPVTGATHTFLAKYGHTRLNKTKINSHQCSKRTGFMEVTLINDKRLIIKSEAQIILKGELRI